MLNSQKRKNYLKMFKNVPDHFSVIKDEFLENNDYSHISNSIYGDENLVSKVDEVFEKGFSGISLARIQEYDMDDCKDGSVFPSKYKLVASMGNDSFIAEYNMKTGEYTFKVEGLSFDTNPKFERMLEDIDLMKGYLSTLNDSTLDFNIKATTSTVLPYLLKVKEPINS